MTVVVPSMYGRSNSESDSSDDRDILKLSRYSSGTTTSFSKFSHQTAVLPGRTQNRRCWRRRGITLRVGGRSFCKIADLRALIRLCSST
ncbi:hypothetical protein ABVT39_025538 [Epinephelus coioides]